MPRPGRVAGAPSPRLDPWSAGRHPLPVAAAAGAVNRAPIVVRPPHPFVAPAVMPSMMKRCAQTKTASSGAITKIVAAMTTP